MSAAIVHKGGRAAGSWQVAGQRVADGRAAGGRWLGGGWQVAGRRVADGRQAGGRWPGCRWQMAGRRVTGGRAAGGRWLGGGWQVASRGEAATLGQGADKARGATGGTSGEGMLLASNEHATYELGVLRTAGCHSEPTTRPHFSWDTNTLGGRFRCAEPPGIFYIFHTGLLACGAATHASSRFLSPCFHWGRLSGSSSVAQVATPQRTARSPFGCVVAWVAARVVDAACLLFAAAAAAA
eukprot:364947-Chlamydomonas_euryale.AAC.8